MVDPVLLSGECNISHTVSDCGEFLITIRGRVGNIRDYDLKKDREGVGYFSAVLSFFDVMSQSPLCEYRNFVLNRPDVYFGIIKM